MTKAEGDGRWIPNTEARRWDASDPEKHTELLNGPTLSDRVHRARAIRLAKAAVKGDDSPVVSSFNVEALALEHVDSDRDPSTPFLLGVEGHLPEDAPEDAWDGHLVAIFDGRLMVDLAIDSAINAELGIRPEPFVEAVSPEFVGGGEIELPVEGGIARYRAHPNAGTTAACRLGSRDRPSRSRRSPTPCSGI